MTVSLEPLIRSMLALPRPVAVACITGISVLLSVVLTLAIMLRTDADAQTTQTALLIAVLVPFLVATPVALVLLGLLHQLDAARRLAHELACTDLLTGVLNRRRFIELAEGELARARAGQSGCALMLLDVDYFKDVNDRHGHHTGDDVLRAVAHACRASLRDEDHFGRWGGEEFVACLPGVGMHDARALAERLRECVKASGVQVGDGRLHVTVSVGVAMHDPALGFDASMARADRAMYQAKVGGRDAVVVSHEAQRQSTPEPLAGAARVA